MQKVIAQFLLLFLLICQTEYTSAQKKYALLVGINNYYDKPGVLHRSVLRGCVNDAMSIRGMLIQRFGFNAANIQTLTNEQATKNNVLAGLNNALAKTKRGDAFVFFFSGHGVWMSNNSQNVLDTDVKKGMNQAMVMSDLYADKLDCLFPDIMVKRIFNQFVDKNVVVTGLFDCCFSGKIAMMMDVFGKNPYEYLIHRSVERSLSFDEVYDAYGQNCVERPDSCNLDSLNITLRAEMGQPPTERSFNLRDNLAIRDSRHIIPPSERPNSMFLSVSGTDEYQKGVEVKDETGTYHGAFTKALLQVIQGSSSNTSFITIFNSVKKLMQRKGYAQSPMHFQDPARLKKNFLGIAPIRFKNNLNSLCKAVLNKEIVLDAGLNDGLAVGNILSLNGDKSAVQIQVTTVQGDEAKAKIVKGKEALVKKGSLFVLTDAHVVSPPVVTVYIPSLNISPAAFDKFFTGQVMPLVKLDNYWDYENWYMFRPSSIILLNNDGYNKSPLVKQYVNGERKDNFLVFLPIPHYIMTTTRTLLSRDQNIQILTSPEKANYILFLNYVKGEKPGFVFTWHKNFDANENNDSFQFLPYFAKIADMHPGNLELKKLSKDMHQMTLTVAQKKSGQWLNDALAR